MTDAYITLTQTDQDQIERKNLLTLSYSGTSLWQHCQQAWYYNYVEELVPKDTPTFFKRGTLIHEMLSVVDQFMQQGVKAHESVILWDAVLEFAETDLTTRLPAGYLELYHRALVTCKKYIYEFIPAVDKDIRILGVEDGFELEFLTPKGRKFLFKGYIDRVHQEADKVWILDRKTSSTGKHWTEKMIDIDVQLLLYVVACYSLGIEVFGVMIDSMSTYPYKDMDAQPTSKLFKRLRSYRSETEVRFALNNFLRVADQIFDHQLSGEAPVRNLSSRHCPSCKYYDLCLFEMKGIGTEILLQERFSQKLFAPGEEGRVSRAIEAQLQGSEQSEDSTIT